jgi:hypothetical protein
LAFEIWAKKYRATAEARCGRASRIQPKALKPRGRAEDVVVQNPFTGNPL